MRIDASLVYLVLFVLLLASCGSDTDIVDLENPIPFEDIEEANYFAVTEPGTAVIEDDAAWTALWEQYWRVFD